MGNNVLNLKKSYTDICNNYIEIFTNKHYLPNCGWAGGLVGGLVLSEWAIFDYKDIMFDVNTNQPKGCIMGWYNGNQKYPRKHIGSPAYVSGLRIDDI